MSEHCPDCSEDHLPNKCDSCDELKVDLAAAKERIKELEFKAVSLEAYRDSNVAALNAERRAEKAELQNAELREVLESVFRWAKSVKRLEEAEGLDAILLLLQKTTEAQHERQ